MTTSTVTPEIAAFARGVREALADLPAEEVDDLTEGLEADLAEAYAEDLQRELPDPAEYATELRSAAGLPMRTKPGRAGLLSGLAHGWRDTRADIGIAIRGNPALAAVLDFLAVLRPVWWTARAWAAAWIVADFFGGQGDYGFHGGWWLLLVAFVVVSVQWGRGRWGFQGLSSLIVVGNVIALVAVPVVISAAQSRSNYDDYAEPYESQYVQGLAFNGHPLENIYVYDAEGKPLHGVQLFDVDGHPLETSRNTDESPLNPQPVTLETGAQVYNVFPLDLAWMAYDANGDWAVNPSPDPGKAKAFRDGPFLKVPAVMPPEKVAEVNK